MARVPAERASGVAPHAAGTSTTIDEELDRLEPLAREIERGWARLESSPREDRIFFVGSTALGLHNFYTICERIFERVASEVNGAVPQTPGWPMRLLESMALDVPEVRPAVLSRDLGRELEEFLKFRHLVRSIYALELEPAKLAPLVARLRPTTSALRREIGGFTRYLRGLAEGLREDS